MIGRRVGALAPFGRARSTLQREAVFHSGSHEVRWVKINWVGGTARSVKNSPSKNTEHGFSFQDHGSPLPGTRIPPSRTTDPPFQEHGTSEPSNLGTARSRSHQTWESRGLGTGAGGRGEAIRIRPPSPRGDGKGRVVSVAASYKTRPPITE